MDLDVLDVIRNEKDSLVALTFNGFGGFRKIGKQEAFHWHCQHYHYHYQITSLQRCSLAHQLKMARLVGHKQ